MLKVSFRPRARLDLKDIYRHIAQFHPPAAEAIIRQLVEKAQLLAESPRIGQATENLGPISGGSPWAII